VAAMLDFRLPVWSHSIETTSIECLDPENIETAVGVSFLAHLQAEIHGGGNRSLPGNVRREKNLVRRGLNLNRSSSVDSLYMLTQTTVYVIVVHQNSDNDMKKTQVLETCH
jgi:hypothetical protein